MSAPDIFVDDDHVVDHHVDDGGAAADPEERWPDRTINDGQRTLGFVFNNEDGTATATDALGRLLGNFPNLERARSAIITNAGRAA